MMMSPRDEFLVALVWFLVVLTVWAAMSHHIDSVPPPNK